MIDPFNFIIMNLFVELFNDDFSDYVWDATMAGLNLNILYTNNYNIQVILKL